MAVSKQQNKIDPPEINSFRKKILAWYDRHQRALPWRTSSKDKKAGKNLDPYHVWLSEIMLQQTTVVTVGPYFEKFIDRWPSIHDLAKADREEVMHEWAGLGYYARARNLHKCAQQVSHDLGGIFPQDQKELEQLAGIGGYTSAAMRAIAFDKPANVVDGNIERVMARLHAVKEPLPDSKAQLKEWAARLADGRDDRPGDYAQALMDLGATICTPTSPKCSLCPVNDMCHAREQGIAADLPRKKAKKPKPQKYGAAFWVVNEENQVLFERRPENVMLGGMLGLPTTEWEEKPLKNNKLSVRHSFTHFDLTLEIRPSTPKNSKILPENDHLWVEQSELEELGLPTLFRKIVKLMKLKQGL